MFEKSSKNFLSHPIWPKTSNRLFWMKLFLTILIEKFFNQIIFINHVNFIKTAEVYNSAHSLRTSFSNQSKLALSKISQRLSTCRVSMSIFVKNNLIIFLRCSVNTLSIWKFPRLVQIFTIFVKINSARSAKEKSLFLLQLILLRMSKTICSWISKHL